MPQEYKADHAPLRWRWKHPPPTCWAAPNSTPSAWPCPRTPSTAPPELSEASHTPRILTCDPSRQEYLCPLSFIWKSHTHSQDPEDFSLISSMALPFLRFLQPCLVVLLFALATLCHNYYPTCLSHLLRRVSGGTEHASHVITPILSLSLNTVSVTINILNERMDERKFLLLVLSTS